MIQYGAKRLAEITDKQARQELWGNLDEADIQTYINAIEEHAQFWNDNVHGLIFVFVKYNTGFGGCIFYPTSRRGTTNGEFGKPGLYLRNGTVVDVSLLGNITPVERGSLEQTINKAFDGIGIQLNKAVNWAIDNWGGENDLNKIDDWLPIKLSRSVVLPSETLDYLHSLPSLYDGDELRDIVWETVRSQIPFLVAWQKQRVADSIVDALKADSLNAMPLTNFLQQLSTSISELRQISMGDMAEQLAEVYVRLDKIDYQYVDIDEFQVPAGTTQAGKIRGKKIKRSQMSIFSFD